MSLPGPRRCSRRRRRSRRRWPARSRSQPRFFRRASNDERVVVGLDQDGTPNAIRVQQTTVLNRLGDYVFAIPAPVRTVLPGPGTESPPGQRTNQILWQGFSPGTRRLSVVADLRVDESAPMLPVKVHFEPAGAATAVVIENVTGVTARSYTADVEPVGLGQVLGRIRNAIRRNFTAEGLNVDIRGARRPSTSACRRRSSSPARF